jgi:hypothetical protein
MYLKVLAIRIGWVDGLVCFEDSWWFGNGWYFLLV